MNKKDEKALETEKKKVPFNTLRKGVMVGLLGVTLGLGCLGLAGCTTGNNGSRWFCGVDTPTNQGQNGDYYLDTDDYILYNKREGQWHIVMTNFGKPGDDGASGSTPSITINGDGYWVIDGVPTDVKAKGENGKAPVITINSDGYWVVDNVDTGVKAKGEDAIAPTIAINEDGYWVINGVVTDVSARGVGVLGDGLVCEPLTVADFVDKKITIVGDSITQGSGATSTDKRYASVLGSILGAEIENLGQSGTTMCTNTGRGSRLTTIQNYSGTTDYFIVALGTNDYDISKTKEIKLGTLGSEDTDTIYGAINIYCKTLKEKFADTDTKIYFSTPIIYATTNGGTFSSTLNNQWGYCLRDVCNAMIETCAMWDIPVLDMNLASGITSENASTTMNDHLHPTDLGHEYMANAMANFLLSNYSYVDAKDVRTITLSYSNLRVATNVKSGYTYILPTPTYADRTFMGWTDSNGKAYVGGDMVKITEDITFYEKVSYSCYNITLVDTYNGTINKTSFSVPNGSTYEDAMPDDLSITNDVFGLVYDFYLDEDCTRKADLSVEPSGHTTLYVGWQTDNKYFTFNDDKNKVNGFSEEGKSNLSNFTKIILPRFADNGTQIIGTQNNSSGFFRPITTLWKNLTDLVIPEGYVTLDSYSFVNAYTANTPNTGTLKVYIPSTLTTINKLSLSNIGIKEFVVDEDNTSFKVVDNILYNYAGTKIVRYTDLNTATSLTIDENVTFDDQSFYGEKTLTTITIKGARSSIAVGECWTNVSTLKFDGDISETYATNIVSVFLKTMYSRTKLHGASGKIYVNSETSKNALITALNALDSSHTLYSYIEEITGKIEVTTFE